MRILKSILLYLFIACNIASGIQLVPTSQITNDVNHEMLNTTLTNLVKKTDSTYQAVVTNNSITLLPGANILLNSGTNYIAITNGSVVTISSTASGGGISNIVINGINGVLSGSNDNVISTITLIPSDIGAIGPSSTNMLWIQTTNLVTGTSNSLIFAINNATNGLASTIFVTNLIISTSNSFVSIIDIATNNIWIQTTNLVTGTSNSLVSTINNATNNLWSQTTNLVTDATNNLWSQTTNLVTQSTNGLASTSYVTNLVTETSNSLVSTINNATTNTITNTVYYAGTTTYTSNRVSYIGTNNFGGSTDTTIPETFPVIVLSIGGQWTDFELKASTNNFANTDGLVYYLISSSTNNYADDTNAWVYFTDDYDTNFPHKWRTATNATPIASQLISTNSVIDYIVVYPSHNCQKNWQDWMSITNTKLVWSFVRFDGADFERNLSGTGQHWNLVVPQWRRQRTGPNGEIDF